MADEHLTSEFWKNKNVLDDPDLMPKLRKDEVVFQKNGIKITIDKSDPYPVQKTDWRFPVVVPNVLPDRNLTREQIHEIFCLHQAHCIKQDATHHPALDECPDLQTLIERCEVLFLEVDTKEFEQILFGLKQTFPNLKMKWKYGRLIVNGAKTKIYAKSVDKVYKSLRLLGPNEPCVDLVVNLITKQLSEIFTPHSADITDID